MAARNSGRRSSPRKRCSSAQFPRERRFSYETPERLKELERGFVLDGVALSRQANEETDRTHPSLNVGIPQYRPLEDRHSRAYYKNNKSLPKLVTKADKDSSSSMMGSVFDKIVAKSEAVQYMNERSRIGAGYTRKEYGGHTSVPTDPPKDGYHGKEGYRRNTPDLRRRQSVFDYEDPFEVAMPASRQLARVNSAPATMRMMRLRSARVYSSQQTNRRAQTALPGHPILLPPIRDLATGPV